METLKSIFKKYVIWMLFSYILIWIVYYTFIYTNQKEKLLKLKEEKEMVEFNYLKIKIAPGFVNDMEKVVEKGKKKVRNFEWLSNSQDPGLALYNYLYPLCQQNNISFIEMENIENVRKLKLKERYFVWKIELSGSFLNLLKVIDKIENGEKYLRIEEIKIKSPWEGEKIIYDLTILGIKKTGIRK